MQLNKGINKVTLLEVTLKGKVVKVVYQKTVEKVTVYKTVKATQTILKSSPSTKGKKLAVLKKGTKLLYLDTYGSYYKVMYGNKTGYILAKDAA